jgi:hypothetical protein
MPPDWGNPPLEKLLMGVNPEPTFGPSNVIEDRRYEFRVPILESCIEIRGHIRFVAEVARHIPPSKFRPWHRPHPHFGRDRP